MDLKRELLIIAVAQCYRAVLVEVDSETQLVGIGSIDCTVDVLPWTGNIINLLHHGRAQQRLAVELCELQLAGQGHG